MKLNQYADLTEEEYEEFLTPKPAPVKPPKPAPTKPLAPPLMKNFISDVFSSSMIEWLLSK